MSLIEILRTEPNLPRRKLLFMGVVAGLSNASILAIIISAAQSIAREETAFRMMVLFGLAIALYAISQRAVFKITVNIFETIVDDIRNRISEKIRQSELLALERIGRSEIHSRLTQGTAIISQASSIIVAGFQGGLIVIFSFIYIATLSRLALLLAGVLVVAGVWIYLRRQKIVVPYIMETSRVEVRFFKMMTHLLDGFNEHKLNRARSADLMRETQAVSSELKGLRIKIMDMLIANQVFSQYFMYIVMAAIVFLLPHFLTGYHEAINEITATLLFIIGPLGAVVTAFPAYTKVNLALQDVRDLEKELDSHLGSKAHRKSFDEPRFSPFAQLELENLEFSYIEKDGRPAFSVGPINLRISGGETVFIIGGNGSGKSTIFKLLVGLYSPDRGNIKVNSLLVDEARIQPYREMFSCVFSDFHLFDRLYGLEGIDTARVNELLAEMQLDKKTQYVNGRFTNIELSSGQRKRLGLIIALLEDRPIFVFDEWAAEQDPEFRKFFYTHILAILKSRNKTVIAITHDEHYFHIADRVLKVEYGRIVDSELHANRSQPI